MLNNNNDDTTTAADTPNPLHRLMLGIAIPLAAALGCMASLANVTHAEPPAGGPWQLVFADEFNGTAADLDRTWEFQNGPSGHILCSRWRENAVLEDGLLRLVARKEERAGQQWTAASLWTKERFQYGYFECRYRYAAATGTNNSFWIMTREPRAADPVTPNLFEIDINEGHYPDEVNMNLHNWSGEHWAKGGRWRANPQPWTSGAEEAGKSFELAQPIHTSRVRLRSSDAMVRIVEFRLFPPSGQGYPSVFPEPREAQPEATNLAEGAKAQSTSTLEPRYSADKAVDGQVTNDSRWVSGKGGEHALTLDLGKVCQIGCVQFISGWLNGPTWEGVVQDFQVEYWDGSAWLPVPGVNSAAVMAGRLETYETLPINLAKTFHVYGLEWNERELIYYFDGQELRRQPHDICRRPAPVWLSLAIIPWAGPVTDRIDGTSMDVDYVRVYQRRPETTADDATKK